MSDPAKLGLADFHIADLAGFTKEGRDQSPPSSVPFAVPMDFRLYYVGRDDVHEILKSVFRRATVSLYLNMFGYDDEELNDILMALAHDPHIATAYTLDKSQSGGVHEKAILASDAAKDPHAYNASFAIGQSSSHQISHTKGFVADGMVGGEGSTNWSTSGEGTFVVKGQPGGVGYKAQNNTQSIFTTAADCARFQAELLHEHLVVIGQGGKIGSAGPPPDTDAAGAPV